MRVHVIYCMKVVLECILLIIIWFQLTLHGGVFSIGGTDAVLDSMSVQFDNSFSDSGDKQEVTLSNYTSLIIIS